MMQVAFEVGGDDLGHDRRIDNAQAFTAVHAGFLVDHSHVVITHLVGAGGVMFGFCRCTREGVDISFRGNIDTSVIVPCRDRGP